ncbi:hypothetical protein L1987_64788 [Smallanthus sonchifolius]|uniref:Uncharacterized protein n=1 Tax=Smallanthus sonchifolius TaxID=185202 RepID=A0ACB9BSJ6_9ASTR|nr:hypothetical protein L1987_64788 [Smallanthus sonchifolius]
MKRLSFLAMKRSSSKKRKKSKGSSVKEIYEANISTKVGKALDPEFKEIEDEEKGMETDIDSKDINFALKEKDDSIQRQDAEKDSELKEKDNSIQKQENDTAKKGKKEVKKSRDEASGVGSYKYKVRRNGRLSSKALSSFTNTADDPICLETDELVKLLYADSVECKGINMDKKMNPFSFWNMSGTDSSASENQEDEEETGDKDVNADIENGEEKEDNARMINEDEKGVEFVEKTTGEGDKQDVEKTIGEGDKQPVEGAEEKKETTSLKENDSVKEKVASTAEYVYDGSNFSIGLTQLESTQEYLDTYKNPKITEEMSVEEQEKQRITEQENTSENIYDRPPLQSKDCDDETKQIKERNLKNMVDGKECLVSGVLKKKDQVIKTIEEKRRNPMREICLAMVSKSPYKLKGVDITEAITKDEELVWEYLFKEDGMIYKLKGKGKGKGKVGTDDESEIVYRNNSNIEVEKFRFKTLKEDTKVFNKVIDAWGDVLNFEEKYRSPTSPYRLLCDTDLIFDWMLKDKETDWPKRIERFILNMNRAVCWNPSLMDLRAIDMVFLPMLENDHYYLIVFELKH